MAQTHMNVLHKATAVELMISVPFGKARLNVCWFMPNNGQSKLHTLACQAFRSVVEENQNSHERCKACWLWPKKPFFVHVLHVS